MSGTDTDAQRPLREVVRSGIDAVATHSLANLVTGACVIALTLPFFTGFAISRGVMDQAEDALRGGGDLSVSAEQFGTPMPVPRRAWQSVEAIPGVTDVLPRIVGPIALGARRERALLVGVSAPTGASTSPAVDGRLFADGDGHELVLGSGIARALGLSIGDQIPPFYRNRSGERVSTVVGVLRADASIWQARMVLTSFETAAFIADQPDAATDLVVHCEPGREQDVERAVARLDLEDGLRLRATSRASTALLTSRELLHREGLSHVLFAFAAAIAIVVVLVTSGLGRSVRRRESGLLRALGWRVDEVLVRAAVENVTVATLAVAASVVLAWVWLELLGGIGLAAFFIRGAAFDPAFEVPYRMLPTPLLVLTAVSVLIVLTGSLSSTWRAATAPPAEAMS